MEQYTGQSALYRAVMERCIELAIQTDPTVYGAKVGAVIIGSDGRVLGEGQKRFDTLTGQLIHAEHAALLEAGREAEGATLVTTLEPCTRRVRTEYHPCASLLSKYGIERVVFGHRDASRKLHGASIANLAPGIELILLPDFEEAIFGLFNREARHFA